MFGKITVIFFIFSAIVLADNNKFTISSKNFSNNGLIPKIFTCQGKNISPELIIKNIPEKTVSLVLITDDPDAPAGTWVHWVLYNIPKNTRVIKENQEKGKNKLSWGAYQGLNSWHKIGYGGPCPPSGTHRYFFKLYAIDIKLNFDTPPTKEQILNKIKRHILSQTILTGKYRKD